MIKLLKNYSIIMLFCLLNFPLQAQVNGENVRAFTAKGEKHSSNPNSHEEYNYEYNSYFENVRDKIWVNLKKFDKPPVPDSDETTFSGFLMEVRRDEWSVYLKRVYFADGEWQNYPSGDAQYDLYKKEVTYSLPSVHGRPSVILEQEQMLNTSYAPKIDFPTEHQEAVSALQAVFDKHGINQKAEVEVEVEVNGRNVKYVALSPAQDDNWQNVTAITTKSVSTTADRYEFEGYFEEIQNHIWVHMTEYKQPLKEGTDRTTYYNFFQEISRDESSIQLVEVKLQNKEWVRAKSVYKFYFQRKEQVFKRESGEEIIMTDIISTSSSPKTEYPEKHSKVVNAFQAEFDKQVSNQKAEVEVNGRNVKYIALSPTDYFCNVEGKVWVKISMFNPPPPNGPDASVSYMLETPRGDWTVILRQVSLENGEWHILGRDHEFNLNHKKLYSYYGGERSKQSEDIKVVSLDPQTNYSAQYERAKKYLDGEKQRREKIEEGLRKEAEERRQQEAKRQEQIAREQAEERARQEQVAREQAEERARQEQIAREQAEERAKQELIARKQAERERLARETAQRPAEMVNTVGKGFFRIKAGYNSYYLRYDYKDANTPRPDGPSQSRLQNTYGFNAVRDKYKDAEASIFKVVPLSTDGTVYALALYSRADDNYFLGYILSREHNFNKAELQHVETVEELMEHTDLHWKFIPPPRGGFLQMMSLDERNTLKIKWVERFNGGTPYLHYYCVMEAPSSKPDTQVFMPEKID